MFKSVLSYPSIDRTLPRSRAVLIGIADYSPVGEGGPDLAGPVNDVENMANTLHILGWPKSTIKIITNKRATTSRIRKLLEWLVKGSKPGDRLFFYYSGHGSQVPDIDLDGSAEDDAETDHLDEIICPHDLDWEGNFVRDDDFAQTFATVHSEANLDVFFDCCFAGSATKTFFNPTVAAFASATRKDGEKRARYLAPPIDFDFHLRGAKMLRNPIVTVSKSSNHTLWSACQEYQTSVEYEMEGKIQGSATNEFCKILRASEGNMTRSQLYTVWADSHARKGDEQVPRIDSNDRMLSKMPFKKTSPTKELAVWTDALKDAVKDLTVKKKKRRSFRGNKDRKITRR